MIVGGIFPAPRRRRAARERCLTPLESIQGPENAPEDPLARFPVPILLTARDRRTVCAALDLAMEIARPLGMDTTRHANLIERIGYPGWTR